MPTSQPEEIKNWISLAIACFSTFGFVAGIGAFVKNVKTHGQRIKALETAVAAIPEDIRKRLYTTDSQPIYVPALRCEKLQAKCSENLEKRMDDMCHKLGKLIDIHMK